jgi:hypothetical protein
MSYFDRIKQLAKTNKVRVTDLIALAPQNDPFYTGTEGDKVNAQWFTDLWEEFGYSEGVHLRRVHYQVISQEPTVKMPNGLPYENTEKCWEFLVSASKSARYLELVDPAAFVDRRNPQPVIFLPESIEDPEIGVVGDIDEMPELPPFPDLPGYALTGFEGEQSYHLEIWCEKSTQNDILLPFCRQYGINLVTGLGELSITATLAVAARIEESAKPARIFYVSDFDPAGQCMPVSVARKIEYWIRGKQDNADVRLFPVVLSAEQVKKYRLPRTPIKDKERRRAGFESRFGTGAVELDALEALHPGELQRVLRSIVLNYYDETLDGRVSEAESERHHELRIIMQRVYRNHDDEIEALRSEYDGIREEFTARLESCAERMSALWETMGDELRDEMPSIGRDSIPDAEDGTEIGEGLYNSERDYIAQLSAYKFFQGKRGLKAA